MSGHNKWSKIKHKKEAKDQKRSTAFSKHLALISTAAKTDPNPSTNPSLRSLIELAKKDNVPMDNINRALNKAAEEKDLSPFTFEAYGPENVALIVEALTDNTNRTSHELRNIAKKMNAKIADPGSVLWAFEKQENNWVAKFPQEISAEAKPQLKKLISVFSDHPDVETIITSAK